MLIFRKGLFSSVTIANFGGTIADLWPRDQIGPAMSVFLWAAVGGSPTGYFIMSFVAGTRPWRHIFWALLGICGGFWIIMTTVLVLGGNETRHSVLLRRRVARIHQATRRTNADVPVEMRPKSVGQLFSITLSRPFRFLSTEAIVLFAAVYNGYVYGLSFLFNGAFQLVFGQDGYGFDTIGVGLCFSGFIIGVSLGPLINIYQEHCYQKRIRGGRKLDADISSTTPLLHQSNGISEREVFQNIPEARLQMGKLAGILLPLSLLAFAWTSASPGTIHWIFPILATALFGFSFYTLILMSYIYVEDSYMVFSASALAGIGLVRNLAGAGFPLFGAQMYEALGKDWAGTVLAAAALLLAPIPFVLERYGVKLRARSRYAREHMEDHDDGDE